MLNTSELRQHLPSGKEVVLLIDFYNMFLRNFYVVPIANQDGEHYGGVFGTLRNMKFFIEVFGPSEVYIISDGPNSAIRRKLIDKKYKANRKKEWKPGTVSAFDFLNEREYKDNFNKQIKRVKEYIDILPVKWLDIPYVEADDIIADIAVSNKDKLSIICSTDHDYNQLVSDRIFCFNPSSKKLLTADTFNDHHPYRPDNYIYFKVIDGDKSDNIEGIRGIGEKTIIKLFPETIERKIDTLEEVFDIAQHNLDFDSKDLTDLVKKKYRTILDNRELLEKNLRLIQLEDVDISLQSKTIIRNLVNDKPNRFNKMKFKMMFIGDKLESQVKVFEDWVKVFNKLAMRGIKKHE